MSDDIFVDTESEITVDFVTGKIRNPDILLCDVSEEELRKAYGEFGLYGIEKHTAYFKYPTYGDTSECIYDDDGIPTINNIKLTERLLKHWTLPDASEADYSVVLVVLSTVLKRYVSD
jgi:hypothetical protein